MASTRVSYSAAGAPPLRAFDSNRLVQQQQQQQQQDANTAAKRAGRKHLATSVAAPTENSYHDGDHTEAISTDGTERIRRNLEQEIRRGMGELQDLTTTTSIMHNEDGEQNFVEYTAGQHMSTTDDEDDKVDSDQSRDRLSDDLRQILEDESDDNRTHDSSSSTSSTSTSRRSIGDDFSLKIGIAGTRSTAPSSAPLATSRNTTLPQQSRMHPNDDSQDLTYLSVSPPSPPPFRQAGKTTQPSTSAAAATANIPSNARTAPLADKVSRPEPVGANRVPTPILTSHAPRLAPYPPSYKTSPPTAVPTAKHIQVPPTPFNDTRQKPPAQPISGTRLSFAASPRYHYLSDETSTTRHRLPDVTGLTEGLQSPAKSRPAQFAGSTGSNDAAAMAAALDQLRQRLATLERENTMSNDRVHELEYRLAKAKTQGDNKKSTLADRQTAMPPGTHQETQAHLSSQLRDEQQKRQALEDVVDNLQQRVSDLTRSLKGQSSVLSQIQSARSHSDQRAKAEMKALRQDLNAMGHELIGLKNVLEDMLRQTEAEQWRKEQEQAAADTSSSSNPNEAHRAEHEGYAQVDPDLTPKANQKTRQWSGPDTPNDEFGTRFAAFAETRKSPSPLPARQRATTATRSQNTRVGVEDQGLKRPVSAPPLPQRRSTEPFVAATTHVHSARSIASYDEDSAAEAVQSRPHAQRSARSAKPTRTSVAPVVEEEEQVEDAQDEDDLTVEFERAQRIFETVETVDNGSTVDQNGDNSIRDGFLVVKRGQTCGICSRRQKKLGNRLRKGDHVHRANRDKRLGEHAPDVKAEPGQTKSDARKALENVLKELEDDFDLQKRIYIELSDRYRAMSSKSNSVKRKTLANHLKQSIDTLEAKALQVKRLHDLLHASD
ncbi:hypothetical protein OIV83_000908 [Microbotryomycetes sp. JL201]|nr:hypothetical protein OIV83_000908 [Microbotryomycetes sp. JL201]